MVEKSELAPDLNFGCDIGRRTNRKRIPALLYDFYLTPLSLGLDPSLRIGTKDFALIRGGFCIHFGNQGFLFGQVFGTVESVGPSLEKECGISNLFL